MKKLLIATLALAPMALVGCSTSEETTPSDEATPAEATADADAADAQTVSLNLTGMT